MNLPATGTRIDYAGSKGTVRYVGSVANSSGIWLGIEWDDARRGKHDGVRDGIRYFHCQVPGAASFIRPSAKISLGRSFLDALSSKYIEAFHGSNSQETVTLGSSDGAIQVEAVDLDKIRAKLADLRRLREVSLVQVARSDPPGAILQTCPDIRGLDLSTSLIPSWDVVAQITSELPNLERLILSRTRLTMPTDITKIKDCFSFLVELQLNDTMMQWPDMMLVTSTMPRLQTVEMGSNHLSQLHTADELASKSSIRNVNIEGNSCNDWFNLCDCFGMYPSLERVVLASNGLDLIPLPIDIRQRLYVKNLGLSFNGLKSWSDINALASWCPILEILNLIGNPLADEKNFRPFVIARISSLKTLDGSLVSQKERDDSELLYLSHIVRDMSKEPSQLAHEHPRCEELRLKHGIMEVGTEPRPTLSKLREHIITLHIYPAASSVLVEAQKRNFPIELASCIKIRVLPSMTLKVLRSKISKVIKGRTGTLLLWQQMRNGALAKLDNGEDTRDLSWLGLQDGTVIVCAFTDK